MCVNVLQNTFALDILPVSMAYRSLGTRFAACFNVLQNTLLIGNLLPVSMSYINVGPRFSACFNVVQSTSALGTLPVTVPMPSSAVFCDDSGDCEHLNITKLPKCQLDQAIGEDVSTETITSLAWAVVVVCSMQIWRRHRYRLKNGNSSLPLVSAAAYERSAAGAGQPVSASNFQSGYDGRSP